MYSLNFKKEWRMNKAKFISFFSLIFVIFVVNMGFYLLIKYVDFSYDTTSILNAIWLILAGMASMLGQILVIIFIYFLVKKDLGKKNIHNTIFTPQSLFAWILPKIIYVFIIQGLFVLLDLVYTYFISDIASLISSGQVIPQFDWKDNIILFLTSTFNIGFFALMTLWMALYYSFRRKGISWLLIVVSTIIYFFASQGYTFYQEIQRQLYEIEYKEITTYIINYGIKNAVGLIFIFISMYLFEKKIEY